MPKIYIKNNDLNIEYKPKKSLLRLLLDNDIFVDNPCNCKGLCGKCKIRHIEGNLPAMAETEKQLLREDEIASGVRLSCLLEPEEDIVIEVLQQERNDKVLTSGYIPNFDFKPSIKKKAAEIQKSTLDNLSSYEDSICKAFSLDELNLNLLMQDVTYGRVTGVFNGKELIGIESGDTTNLLYGVAVDIGTTTLVTALIDINTGRELGTASMTNPQKKYGLDILTRITYVIENPESVKELQGSVVGAINELIDDMCNRFKVEKINIYEITIAANCTMMHFLLGIKATSIGKAPYIPVFKKSKNISAKDIGLKASWGARLHCLPSSSSYIGADIVAGIYASQLHKTTENILFIDIGTNGELVLSNKGKLLSCSCAAGPALEGMNISFGMRATDGAIEDVKISESGIEVDIIGNQEPVGICGSGLLSVVKELIRIGLVKKDGAFIRKEEIDEADYRYDMLQLKGDRREFVIKNTPQKLLITQQDIRQVQLAKGAILSGFHALISQAGIEINQIDQVIISGQFGSHLSAESLVGAGVLPMGIEGKLSYVGNSSKTGAYMALMSVDVKKEVEEIAEKVDYIELGASEGYERLFTNCLMFPESERN